MASIAGPVLISSRAVYVDADGRHLNGDEPPWFDGPINEEAPTLPPAGGDVDPFTREGYAPSKVAVERVALDSGIPWDDLQAEHNYSAAATYNLTKLLNVLFTYELARRWAGTSVTANALHPGWPLKTNLGREQTGPGALFDRAIKLIGSSAAKGARTSLYLAGSPDVAAVTGQYFSRCRPAKSSALSHNTAAPERLWARSAELCGLPAS